MITLETRKVVTVDKPKAGHYKVHFDDGSSTLLARLTGQLGVLDKAALKFWAANIEREYVIEKFIQMGGVRDAYRFPLPIQVGELRKLLGEKKAHQMRLKEAGAIGTSLHKAIQTCLAASMLTGTGGSASAELEGPALLAYMAWEDWAESVALKPTHVETRLASERLDAGGTMDCAGDACNPEMDGRKTHTYFDWKSSKRSKTAPNGIYPESEIQVSAYRKMGIEMGIGDDDSWAAVVRLPKNEDDPCLAKGSPEPFDVLWIDPDRADYLAGGFEHISKTFSFMAEAFPK